MRSNIHSIRKIVAAVRAALLTPSIEGVDSHVPALQQAAAALEQLRGGPPEAGSRGDLEALARDLRACGRLIAQGLAFTQGMARVLAPAATSYRPDGEPVPLKAPGTLLVRG
jgi:hypothetical protein